MLSPTKSALAATWFVDANHPDVRAFARNATAGASPLDVIRSLFAAVRDEIPYDPYTLDLDPDTLRASAVLRRGRAWCVPKAILFAAACRAIDIPARLGFADVRNHLSSAKLADLMGTDVFAWHGYTEVEVEGTWRKATPAFNRELCHRFGVEPLEFDGTADALLHAYDGSGRRHMEYVHDRGAFDDLPYETMAAELRDMYPTLLRAAAGQRDERFHATGS